MVKTLLFHGSNTGSNPVGSTKERMNEMEDHDFLVIVNEGCKDQIKMDVFSGTTTEAIKIAISIVESSHPKCYIRSIKCL